MAMLSRTRGQLPQILISGTEAEHRTSQIWNQTGRSLGRGWTMDEKFLVLLIRLLSSGSNRKR